VHNECTSWLRDEPDGALMTKPEQTEPREAKAGVRFVKPPHDAINVRRRPLMMTATLKRRALRKKPGKPEVAALSVIK
jgi:hypothetical protein